ncbi:HalOD1 output domain-containing protein [Halobaculum magnesiiphilum]|uniref:Halobacterial output domain-containing protein n=1 Tax=Halobaculum magnesiiphilum TaxID=1017351 RepID=A0A8T8WF38_9EURY|nr:HalOD1 output domain-containing protein [Halobaculum magnesiiphilum]QZP38353.1 hypothetical protein K6T50_04205 [Halobaculum magnesiiphilum]
MTRTSTTEEAEIDDRDTTDPAGDGSPVSAVIGAVAAVENVDPVELNTTLQGAVDADALASLARHEGSEWRLEFPLGDHEVAVEGGGTVVVDDRVFSNQF